MAANDSDSTADSDDQPLIIQDNHQNEEEEQRQAGDTNIVVALNSSNDEKTVNKNTSSNGENKNDTKDDFFIDSDSELARMMMAIQEEEQQQQEEDTAAAWASSSENVVDRRGQNFEEANNNIEFDPNIAYIGLQDDIPNADAADDDALHNNPAAIALRQRQALQNQRRADQINAFNNQPFFTRLIMKIFRPLCRYTPLSIIGALALLHHTLRTRQQFYLALVYVQSSKLSYIVFGNAIIALAVSTFSFVTRVFLDGGLRPNERDAIGDNIRWDVTETCLALTIFRSELDVVTAVMFLGLVVMKCLHWSAELRGSHLRMTEEVLVYPEDLSNAQTRMKWYKRIPHLRMTHVRYYMFLYLLLTVDLLSVARCALSVATDGPSVDILFGFEFAIMLISAASSIMSYNLHAFDGLMGFLHHWAEGEHHHCPVGGMAEPNSNELEASNNERNQEGSSSGSDDANNRGAGSNVTQTQKSIARILLKHFANPWRDQRATFSFVIELQAQAAKFLFYVVFFAIVFTYYGMPINIFREVYVSFQQLRRRLIAFNNYRRLTNNMEKRFESVTDEEELDRLGHTCIICRDHMNLLGGCKKLPGCGHAFHTHCLREWLVQQQSCPTCRADIAANEARMKKEKQKAAAAAAAAAGEGVPPTTTSEQVNGEATAQDMAQGQPQVKGSEQATSSQPNPVTQKSTSDELPPGWTEHTDRNTGRKYYYNNNLHTSTWERPQNKAAFPCLYRVTSPAAVYPADLFSIPDDCPSTLTFKRRSAVMRTIPAGKIIVCTSEKSQLNVRFDERSVGCEESRYSNEKRSFLRIPDGYVMDCNVEKMFELTSNLHPPPPSETKVSWYHYGQKPIF